MSKAEILKAIDDKSSKLEILKAVYSHHKEKGDLNRIDQFREAIHVAVDTLLDLHAKLKKLEKEEV
jgi:hypothetical protein